MGHSTVQLPDGTIAYDDSAGHGPLMVLLPGAGDVRQEYRFLVPELTDSGRVVTMDLRGHGDSSANWPAYGIADTAADLISLLQHLDSGPATVVGTSFSPTAALWAAAEHPELIDRLVLISAHLHDAPGWQNKLMDLSFRGPIASMMWPGQYRKWHPGAPPDDLGAYADRLGSMLEDPHRRRAVRETLLASRNGLSDKIQQVDVPTLVMMGSADSHFPDPRAEGEQIAATTGGTLVLVPDAGHYPHAEFPEQVAKAIISFMEDDASPGQS